MKNLTILLTFLLSLLLLTNCNNDTDIDPTPNGPTSFDQGVMVTTTIAGFVLDENNTPLDNAEVRLGNNIVQTDINGFYLLDNISTNSKDTYITIWREGYINSSKRIYPTNQSTFKLDFKLLRDNTLDIMPAGEGKEVSLPNGAKLLLTANSVSFPDGSAYNGDVHISMHHLSPNDTDLSLTMPGDLTAIDANGNIMALATYGMLSVELTSDAGDPLQLSEGSTAELSFPVPSNLIGNAPATIPLWFFDEILGRWIEEGMATLEGDTYVGEVSHFSFWNVDVPYDLVFVSGKVLDQDGSVIQNLKVKVEVSTLGVTRSGNTDTEGNFSGLMPKDEQLNFNFNLISTFCGSEETSLTLASQTYGPFSSDTDLGIITVDLNQSSGLTEISGSLVDCNGEPLQNAYLKFDFDGNQTFEFSNTSDFMFIYPNCEFDQLTIEAINVESGDLSIPQTFSTASLIQTGPIPVCGGSNLSCLLSDDDFSGFYILSYIGDATGGFGIPFPEGPMTINTVNGSLTKRSFNLPWLPSIIQGGFPVMDFIFDFVCDEVVVEDFDSGAHCGGRSITIVQGGPSSIDLTNDEEIILNIIDYHDDGGCGFDPTPKTIRLVKQ